MTDHHTISDIDKPGIRGGDLAQRESCFPAGSLIWQGVFFSIETQQTKNMIRDGFAA
jgi:hypothetical protein